MRIVTVYNFSAGPAVMPKPVIDQIQREMPSFNDSGMSILEISHRSTLFENVLNDAKQNIKDLMHVPDNYHILFCQGGGTGQFAAVPLNLANHREKIAFLDSGHWNKKAYQEAEQLGYGIDVIKENGQLPYPSDNFDETLYDYLHVTINNTIEGSTYHPNHLPNVKDIPLVGDMSSNFMAESYDVNDFGLIFAGAQKNLAPAGLTIVIVRDDLIDPAKHIPTILNYEAYAKKNSMFNTPPVFPIYAAKLTTQWLLDNGGITEMEKRDIQKSSMLYDYLDQSKLFHNNVKKDERSYTNIVFTTNDDDLDAKFVDFAADHDLVSLKGHRSIGGLRASLYNAMPIEGVEKLIDVLTKFEQTRG